VADQYSFPSQRAALDPRPLVPAAVVPANRVVQPKESPMSTQITIPSFNPANLAKAVDGYKTYITLAVGMVVIAANHFGWLPPSMTPPNLDPNNWVNEEFALVVAAFFRSGITKAGSGAGPGSQPGGAIGG
jgi:hypothetical protein